MTGTYFASQPQWQAGQDRRCGELVLQYFATIPEATIRQQVAFECQIVIRQLNIEVRASTAKVCCLYIMHETCWAFDSFVLCLWYDTCVFD